MKAFFLVGPTASGKSRIAQRLAEAHGFDILSADSMLVYRGMDVGTAKPSPEERARVRYHGVDLVTPDQSFNVAAYRDCAIDALRQAEAPVIVVGGTGLYVKSLILGLDRDRGGDPEQRARWERRLKEEGLPVLLQELRSTAPAIWEALVDKQNPRRVLRALDVASTGQKELPRSWHAGTRQQTTPVIGLQPGREVLTRRIAARVGEMYAGGLLDEVRQLRERFPVWSRTAGQAIGYKEACDVLDGVSSESEAREMTAIRTRRLAKRQRTWFRHQARVRWVDVPEPADVERTAEQVKALWDVEGPTEICDV